MHPPQYNVLLVPTARDDLQDVIHRATARGQATDALWAARKIFQGLRWLADELGESRYPLNVMGELRVVVIGPVGCIFAVDRNRMLVQVGRFRLLGVRRG